MQQETFIFKSEIKQLLKLMINSLYSNKEIFLRELISNASDAADKLRFLSLSNPSLYEGDSELKIRISIDKEKNILIISDNGIGMSRDEVIKNLGTIAHSGTKNFIEKINSKNTNNSNMIGQFGVGFYSSFIVAEKVSVITRLAGLNVNKGVFWESSGKEDYIIKNVVKTHKGTEVYLHLRKKEKEFLELWNLKNVISKYSDHINIPVEIEIFDKKTNSKYWEQINKAQAIWTRKKNEITDKEYEDFYKYITHDNNNPLLWTHNFVEGKQNYICLLYIPSQAPYDIWNFKNKKGLKLYVNRVFIMDDVEQFIPNYLRFVRGIIDSNNLPLNISRELLQDNYITKNLRSSLSRRILSILEKTSKNNKEKYLKFWNQFGSILKEGPAEDTNNISIISKLLRFSSTHSMHNDNQEVSLEDYINRMPKTQEYIYYITADNYLSAKNSPHLEIFYDKNIEVLLLYDRIDEWMMNYLVEFNNKKFKLVSKTDININNNSIKEEKHLNKTEKNNLDNFIENIKDVLGNKIKDVKVTYRLNKSPAILTTESNDISTQMAKLLTTAGQQVPNVQYLFEINPNHKIIKNIISMDKNDRNDWINFIFYQSLLAEKGSIENINEFVTLTNNLLLKNMFFKK